LIGVVAFFCASTAKAMPLEHCKRHAPRREMVCARRALRARRGEARWIVSRRSRTLFAAGVQNAHYWRSHLKFVRWRIRVDRASIAEARSAVFRGTTGTSGWDRVAACESGGDWSLVTGNGFYWGLQWLPSTWDGRAAALGFPSWSWFVRRHAAPSRAMQIRAATGMSLSAWPVCGARY